MSIYLVQIKMVPAFALYTAWAGFSERSRDGSKFIVAEKPQKQGKFCSETVEAVIEERKLRKETVSEMFDDKRNGNASSNFLDSLFSDE